MSSRYKVRYQITQKSGLIMKYTAFENFHSDNDQSYTITEQYKNSFKDDKNFKIFSITKVDDEQDFVNDFRNSIQKLRDNNKLKSDKIYLEVFCDLKKEGFIRRNADMLKSELLAIGIDIFPKDKVIKRIAHKIIINTELIYVNLYKADV